ncbi:MAG: hypothetical protein ACXWI9_15050 [Burkholderiales bacterium]
MAYIANWHGAAQTEALMAQIKSDDPAVHNPKGIPFFLVSEVADTKSRIIEPRMRSLGVRYIECR